MVISIISSSTQQAALSPSTLSPLSGFKWSGAGQTLFGGGSTKAESAEDNPEAYEAESSFKPVLEVLPDLVEVKTG